MTEENFKLNVAKNLVNYRKINNLTQLELAEKLNYSDKAISKWERGESIPDLYTLSLIANFYGITINDLCAEEKKVIASKKENKRPNRIIITILSTLLVWFIATLVFVALKIFISELNRTWISFIAAIPVSFIVLTVFSCIWGNHLKQGLSVTGLVWSLALLIHLTFLQKEHTALIYIIAIPFQVMIIFWYILQHNIKKGKIK